jgi:hypothetical protein
MTRLHLASPVQYRFYFPLALVLAGCDARPSTSGNEVRRADPQDRVVAFGEPLLDRKFDIVMDPTAFDGFCAAEKEAGRMRLAQCSDGLFRRCVSNRKAQWVVIPGTPGKNFLECVDEVPFLGMDIIDRSLPAKRTAFYDPDRDTRPVDK